MNKKRFFLLYGNWLPYWGYQIVTSEDSKSEITEAFYFLLDFAKEEEVTSELFKQPAPPGLKSIIMYEIKHPYTLKCVIQNRHKKLIESDFEAFHRITNRQEPLYVYRGADSESENEGINSITDICANL